MNSNSDNPKVGKQFQIAVKDWFQKNYNCEFEMEKRIAIGVPAKLHSFDISDINETTVIECKCYTWTESGNVPSAKMGFTNEAAFYLSFLPDNLERIIVMAYAVHPKRAETLAEYYFRTNRHLLGRIKIMEYDSNSGEMKTIGQNEV